MRVSCRVSEKYAFDDLLQVIFNIASSEGHHGAAYVSAMVRFNKHGPCPEALAAIRVLEGDTNTAAPFYNRACERIRGVIFESLDMAAWRWGGGDYEHFVMPDDGGRCLWYKPGRALRCGNPFTDPCMLFCSERCRIRFEYQQFMTLHVQFRQLIPTIDI
jgi:hypothetical protein